MIVYPYMSKFICRFCETLWGHTLVQQVEIGVVKTEDEHVPKTAILKKQYT